MGSETTTQQQSQLPAWYTQAAQGNVANAQAVAGGDLSKLGIPPLYDVNDAVAPLTQYEQLAGAQILRGTPNPNMGRAIQLLSSPTASRPGTPSVGGQQSYDLTPIDADSIKTAMDPELNSLLDQIRHQGDIERTGNKVAALRAGVFGSRRDVADNLSFDRQNRATSDATSTAYNTALSTLMNKRAQEMQQADLRQNSTFGTADRLVNYGETGRSAQQSDLQNLLGFGQLSRSVDQNRRDFQFNQFSNVLDWPSKMQQLQNSSLTGVQLPQNSSQTQNDGGKTAMQVGGTIAMAAAVAF
jgi:hypothetical protein